jgi:hypothetical protein
MCSSARTDDFVSACLQIDEIDATSASFTSESQRIFYARRLLHVFPIVLIDSILALLPLIHNQPIGGVVLSGRVIWPRSVRVIGRPADAGTTTARRKLVRLREDCRHGTVRRFLTLGQDLLIQPSGSGAKATELNRDSERFQWRFASRFPQVSLGCLP